MGIDWVSFSPWPALAGGVLIGCAATLLVLANGRVAGISGILGGLLGPWPADWAWRIAFLAGLMIAPLAWIALAGAPTIVVEARYPVLVAAGLLVGIGTRYASGCTSGHGVCGLSRMSPRSLAATLAFMAAGFATVYVTRHLLGD